MTAYTVDHALHTKIHLDSARHSVDHLLSWTIHPLPAWANIDQHNSNFILSMIIK